MHVQNNEVIAFYGAPGIGLRTSVHCLYWLGRLKMQLRKI